MEAEYVVKNRKIYVWHPMWGHHLPRNLSLAEKESIVRIKRVLNVADEFIETMFDSKGEKILRVKVAKGMDSGIPLFDYHFFGPIFVQDDSMHCKVQEYIASDDPEVGIAVRTLILDEGQLVSQLSNLFNSKKIHGEKYDYHRDR